MVGKAGEGSSRLQQLVDALIAIFLRNPVKCGRRIDEVKGFVRADEILEGLVAYREIRISPILFPRQIGQSLPRLNSGKMASCLQYGLRCLSRSQADFQHMAVRVNRFIAEYVFVDLFYIGGAAVVIIYGCIVECFFKYGHFIFLHDSCFPCSFSNPHLPPITHYKSASGHGIRLKLHCSV